MESPALSRHASQPVHRWPTVANDVVLHRTSVSSPRSLLEAQDDEAGMAPSAWRKTVAPNSDQVSIGGSTTGVSSASFWKMHNILPFCLFANCGDQAIVFDIVGDTPNRTLDQAFVATSADICGGVVCLGVKGGAQVARVDWGSDSTSTSWQSFALDIAGGAGLRSAIEVVACSPTEKGFAAGENHNFHFWDYARPHPVFSVATWQLGVRSSCASVDSTGQQCLLGSTRGSLLMIDFRQKAKGNGVAWRVSQGHDQEGTSCVSWHPHVSHWFASSGLDGAVRVWDARATKTPVRDSPLAHGGGVRSIAWSPGHSELLVSVGSADRSATLWNWRMDPAQRLFLPSFGENKLLGVGWVEATMVAGDAGGNLVMATMSAGVLQPMCPAAASEEPMRRLLYARDLAAAFPLVVERAQHLMTTNKLDEALELVESCYPRRLAVSDLSSAAEAAAAFDQDVLAASSFLPPGYVVPAHVNTALASLKKLRIMLMLQQMRTKELWREAFGFTDDICKGLRKAGQRKDSLQINPDIVTDTVAMVLRHHYLSGVSMGGKILRALKEEEFGRFSSLTRLLLSPTVFDGFVGGAAQASTDLDYVLSNAKVGLSQVEFVRDFTSRMWNSESPFSRVQKMMKKTESTLVSVSATVNRVYLGSLLQTGSYAKFFACVATISLAAPYCDFSVSVLPGIIAKGCSLASEWSVALIEELRRSFSLASARALAQLLAVMLGSRLAAVLPKTATEAAGKKLMVLARLVPVDAASAAALLQVISVDGVGDDVKSAIATLQLKT